MKVDDTHQCKYFSKLINRCAKVPTKLVPIAETHQGWSTINNRPIDKFKDSSNSIDLSRNENTSRFDGKKIMR